MAAEQEADAAAAAIADEPSNLVAVVVVLLGAVLAVLHQLIPAASNSSAMAS